MPDESWFRRREPVVVEPADHAIGRSQGGLTTKIPLLADDCGRPLVLLLTAGNVTDTTMFAPLLDALRVAQQTLSRAVIPRYGCLRQQEQAMIAGSG